MPPLCVRQRKGGSKKGFAKSFAESKEEVKSEVIAKMKAAEMSESEIKRILGL